MSKIPFRQILWGPTVKLAFARAWASGFVLVLLMGILSRISESSPMGFGELFLMWVFSPLVLLFIGGIFAFLSLFPMGGWAARLIGILIFCWGDPILYVFSRVLGVFKYVDLKPFNFVAFLYLLEEENNQID